MNFASQIASNQRFNLAAAAVEGKDSPENLVEYFLGRLSAAPFATGPMDGLHAYLRAGGTWTGSTAQLRTKAPGLSRLIVGSAEYQFV